MTAPTLFVLAGAPGTGKSTLSRDLSQRTGAFHIRIDAIEAALRTDGSPRDDLKDTGYKVARALAGETLANGQSAIIDAVHDLAWLRHASVDIGKPTNAQVIGLHVTCHDPAKHKARIDHRKQAGDRYGADWDNVSNRLIDPPLTGWKIVDTSEHSTAQIIETLMREIRAN